MRKRMIVAVLSLAVFALGSLALAQQAPQAPAKPKPDAGKILGTWNLEVSAEGSYFYLTMVLEQTEGKLTGKVSEQNGMFTDAALGNIEYTGAELSADVSVPSPPDGTIRTWALKFKVGEETLEGTISNADMGMTAAITGKRVKK